MVRLALLLERVTARPAVRAVTWSSTSQFGRQIIQLVTILAIARFVGPTSFGLVSMAAVVVGLVNLFKDMGTAAAVIQRVHPSESLLSTLYWANLVLGGMVTIVLIAVSGPIAQLFDEPRLIPLLWGLSPSFLFSGLSIIQQALLEKRLAFRRLAVVEIVGATSGGCVGVGGAILGMNEWALVLQILTASAVTSALLIATSGWNPSRIFNLGDLRSVARYSLGLTGYNLFNYFARNADYALIGRFLGAEALGYYSLAYRIMYYLLQAVVGVMNRVMFPLYAAAFEKPHVLRQLYARTVRFTAFLGAPMMLGMAAVAQPFMVIAFGTAWVPAGQVLTILACVGAIQMLAATTGPVYQSVGRTDLLFAWGALSGTATVAAFTIGLQFGIVGVAAAYLTVTLVLTYPVFAIPLRLLRLPIRELVVNVWRPIMAALMMSAAVGVASVWVVDWITFVAVVFLGAIAYLALTILFNRQQLREFAQFAEVQA